MKRLRELRHATGITQSEIAKYLEVDRTTYTKYETGDREPDYETLKKIAKYLNTSVSYLIGEIDNPTPLWSVPKESTSKEVGENNADTAEPVTQNDKANESTIKRAILNDRELSVNAKKIMLQQLELVRAFDNSKYTEEIADIFTDIG